jgi:hypothetical protein
MKLELNGITIEPTDPAEIARMKSFGYKEVEEPENEEPKEEKPKAKKGGNK